MVSKDFSDQQGIASLLRVLTSSSTLQNQTPQTTNPPPNFLPPLSTSSKKIDFQNFILKAPTTSKLQEISSLGTQALSERGPLPCLQSKQVITLPRPFEPEPHSLPVRGLTHPLRASASPNKIQARKAHGSRLTQREINASLPQYSSQHV